MTKYKIILGPQRPNWMI